MIGTVPSWVGDATAICALIVGVGAVVALVIRAAKPGFTDLVEKAVAPKFDDLTGKIDAANKRLDEHMAREERQGAHLIRVLDGLVRRLDDHITNHPGGDK